MGKFRIYFEGRSIKCGGWDKMCIRDQEELGIITMSLT